MEGRESLASGAFPALRILGILRIDGNREPGKGSQESGEQFSSARTAAAAASNGRKFERAAVASGNGSAESPERLAVQTVARRCVGDCVGVAVSVCW